MKKIAIIGATGLLGQPVTKAFIQSGYTVSIFARDVEKAKVLFGKTVRIIKGNLNNPESIRHFLEGQHALYLNLSVHPESAEDDFQPEREGLKNILQACRYSEISRIGYLSSLIHLYQNQNGFNWWAFDIKKNAVLEVKAAGPSYSIFYASTFMEFFENGIYRDGDKLQLAGTSKYPMHLISGSDYGKQVVRTFELNHDGNNSFVIQGTEAYLPEEAAEIIAQKTNIRVAKRSSSIMKLMGRWSKKHNYTANFSEALNNYQEKFDAEKTWNELGKPLTKLHDYASKKV